MKRLLTLLSLMALAIICLTCKKEPEVPVAQVKIAEAEKVFEFQDGHISVTFSGTYAYVGTIKKITLQVGTAEDMTGATSQKAQVDETSFTVKVEGLSADTKYFYRYAVDYGGAKEYETEVKDFVTPALPLPTVTTAEVTEYSATTAKCGGKVTSTGNSEVTERGVCWSTDHNADIEGSHKASEGGGESFTVEVTDLSPETTYYVRAYAKNEAGVGYGAEVSFTTAQVEGFLVSVSANPTAGGTVSGGGEYTAGAECTVTAAANQGYTFAKWTENDSQVFGSQEYTFTVTGNRNLVAQFQVNSYTINVSAEPQEGGTVSGGGDFHYGEECTLTATAAQGYRFVNWTKGDDVVYGEPSYTFQVTESASYVAHFQVAAFDLDVTANPNVIPQGGSSHLEAAASGGNGSFTYSWDPSSSLDNATIHNPTASPVATTTYTCTVTSGGQTGSGSCTVTVVCPPDDLTATVENNSDVVLNWPATTPATSFKVYKDNVLIASNITTTTYRDSGLNPGTYNYQVTAVYQYVESPKSKTAVANIYDSLSVTATANPSVIPFGSSSTLTANPIGGDGNYTYEWSPSTGLNNAHIQSPTTSSGSTKTYTVTVTSNGETASAAVTVYVVKAPTNLTASVQNGNNIYLHWNAADPADSYNVYRNNTLIDQGVNTNSYFDNGLSSGTYSYQVSAVYQGVESQKSNSTTPINIENGNWLYYGGNNASNSFGYMQGGTYVWAVRFPPEVMAPYVGTSVTKVKAYLNVAGEYTPSVHLGGTTAPTTTIYLDPVTVTNIGWNEFQIDPIEVPADQALWVSFSKEHTAGQHPASQSGGINNPDARWRYTNTGWTNELIQLESGLTDVCWMIRAFVTPDAKGGKGKEIELPQMPMKAGGNGGDQRVSSKPNRK